MNGGGHFFEKIEDLYCNEVSAMLLF